MERNFWNTPCQHEHAWHGCGLLDAPLLDTAAVTLATAFHADPMFVWIFPDPAERTRALSQLFRVPLKYGLRRGYVTQSGAAKAVAIWARPGRTVTPLEMIRSGMLSATYRVGIRPISKFIGAMDVLERIHKCRMSVPHWYLMLLGVDTEHQGQGRGAALVREGIDRADREGSPCYLETSEPRNLGFYERLGFEVVETTRLGTDGPEAWALLREATKP